MVTKKKEDLTNDEILKLITTKKKEIKELQGQLKPIAAPKQASLAHCNSLAAKAKTQKVNVNPKLLSKENV